MSEKLKPCPLCGGKVEIEKTIDGTKWYGVVCRNSINLGGSCAVQIRASATKDSAIKRWNARAADKIIAEKDALLIKALSKLEGLQAWIFLEKLEPSISVDGLIISIKQHLGGDDD